MDKDIKLKLLNLYREVVEDFIDSLDLKKAIKKSNKDEFISLEDIKKKYEF